jgi:hypothetical protein
LYNIIDNEMQSSSVIYKVANFRIKALSKAGVDGNFSYIDKFKRFLNNHYLNSYIKVRPKALLEKVGISYDKRTRDYIITYRKRMDKIIDANSTYRSKKKDVDAKK